MASDAVPIESTPASTSRVLTVPNVISIIRLCCIPVFLWLLFAQDNRAAAAWLLGGLGATDWIDGYIARRYGQVSELGKVLDPTADRLLFIVAVGAMIIDGAVPPVFAWLVVIREAALGIVLVVMTMMGMQRFDVTYWGKAATCLLMFAFPAFLLGASDFPGNDTFQVLGWLLGLPGLVLSYYSAITYVPMIRDNLRAGRAKRAGERGGPMKAVIMAGGEGTRLRPMTSNAPKPMLPIANRPMMEHVISLLRRHGFDEIVVTVAFLATSIKTYFGDGSEYGVSITYADEPVPMGTAGSVGNARRALRERFLVISGDVITDIDLSRIWQFHDERGALATIGLTPVENPLEFGIVIAQEDGTIERFLEKPTWGQVFSDTINTGIYVFEPEIFDYIPSGRSVDFSSEVFPKLLADHRSLYGAVAEGYWGDIGTFDAYLKAHKDVLDERVRLDIPGFRIGRAVWLGDGAEVSPDAEVVGPALIGPGCKIEAGCRLGEYTVLGSNVRMLADAQIERSVVHDNVYIGSSARIRGAVLGRSSSIRTNARVEEGTVLGDEVFVGSDAILAGDLKIYPFKTIEDGAVVNSSIVWESRGARSLFGREGVSGIANVDVTPELAAKVAMAYATSLRKGTTVITSRDSSRAARMLKRAVMAGLNAAGIDVLDLEVASVPVTRFLVRSPRAFGGLTIRLDPDDLERILIRFFDDAGSDISEDAQRKIERLFQREDFRRVLAEEIGDIEYPPRAIEDYTAALDSTVDRDSIEAKGFKIVVDYAYGATSIVMPSVLGRLGADALAVNPYTSTVGRIGFDHRAAAERVAGLVRASGAHLGAVFDPDGERLTLIDDEGRVLTDTETTLAYVQLVCGFLLGDRIAVPINVTGHVRRLAEERGVAVTDTKISTAALMAAATEPGVGFAADGRGGFIIPGFLPAFDAAASLAKMLDLLARTELRLSEVVAGLPKVHLAHETVVTPWEQKGMIMRSLVEMAGRGVQLVDGVKAIHGDSWVLALPDPEEPITHVWSESTSDGEARRLAQEYGRRIRQLLR